MTALSVTWTQSPFPFLSLSLSLTDVMIVPHRTLPMPSRRIGSPQASEGYSNDAAVSLALQRCNLDLDADKRVTPTPASA